MTMAIALLARVEGRYSVIFPDVPGCVTGGRTHEEACLAASQALAGHVEVMDRMGAPLPRFRTLEELERDPEWAEDVKDGQSIPVFLDLPGRAQRINITLEERLLARIDAAAKAAGESRSAYLANAAKARLAGLTPL
jgi:predicted RNase H-like HicB family nuclease